MPALRSTLRSHPAATLGLLVLFLIAATAWVRDAHDRLDEMFHGGQYVKPTFDLNLFTFEVTTLRSPAEAAGLRKGDLLVAVNGRAVSGIADYDGSVRNARAGDQLRVRVQRITTGGSRKEDFSIPLAPFTYVGYRNSSPAYWCLLALRLITPFLCLALGFWVAAVRVYDPAAWTLLIILLSVANLITDGRTLFGNQDALQPILTSFSFGAIIFGPVALAYFGITFPKTLALDRDHPWIKWILLGPMLARAAFMSVVFGLLLHHHALTLKLQPAFQAIAAPGDALEAIAIGTFFYSMFYKTAKAVRGDARRRLLLLDSAAVAGLLPFLVVLTVCNVRGIAFQGWYAAAAIAMLFIFPVAMAYVIVVDRAMDVRVAVRQGVQYLLATGGIRVLQVAISVGIIVAAASMTANTSVLQRVLLITLGLVLLAGVGGFVQRLRGWIDRRFFRDAYEADAVLADLAAKVRTIIETGPLLETVASSVAAALHVPRIAILLDGEGMFRPAYALGYSATPAISFSHQSLTVTRLGRAQHALVQFDKADSWVQLADAEERAALQELKPE